MSEVAEFARHRASLITPRNMEDVQRKLPLLKAEFTQIEAPKYPHLVDQLELLADLVEDFNAGLLKDMPYAAATAATFALIYAHRIIDLIPDSHPHGHADDSSVVRSVLLMHERAFSAYAETQGVDWDKISKP
jgi:uncharacterized membrane protein YkvA (DUF1232 family)